MEWNMWTGWHQLTGEVIDESTLIDNIRSLPAMDTLRVLSMIDTVLEFDDTAGETDLKLLCLIRNGTLLDSKLVSDVKKGATILFHSQARYALTQMIFKYTELDADLPRSIPDISVWKNVLTAVLQLSDHIYIQNHDVKSLKSYFIQSLQFRSEENWSSQLLRTYEQYVNIAPTVSQDLDNGEGIVLDEIVQRTFGTNLRELFANEFALFTYLQNQHDERPSHDSIPTTAYIGSAILEQNPTLQKLLAQFSLSFDEFKQHIEPYSFHELLWPIRHFKQSSILRLGQSLYIPLGLTYFVGRMGGGMYYSLIDNVPKDHKRQFQSYIGRIFEEWAVSELRKVYPEHDRIEFFERSITKTQRRKLPEAVSFYREGNIIWECKTKRLTVSVYESGNMDTYESDVLEGVGKGIEQTYDVSRQIAAGNLLKDKVLSDTCLPVIITLEPYPLYGVLRQDVETIHQSSRPENALTPLVLSSFDFNLLCDYGTRRHLNIWMTLTEWSKLDNMNGNSMSLYEFLISQYGKPRLNKRHDVLIKQIIDDAKNLYGFTL